MVRYEKPLVVANEEVAEGVCLCGKRRCCAGSDGGYRRGRRFGIDFECGIGDGRESME